MSKREKLSAFLEAFARWHTSDAPFRALVTAWEEYLATPDDHPPSADECNARIAELEKQLAERDNQLTLARGDVEVYRKQLASANIRLENIALANAPRSEAEQLAERSPGVMPECVKKLSEWIAAGKNVHDFSGTASLMRNIDEYYATPGDEWQPVDAEHPITAEDVGLMVYLSNGGTDPILRFDNSIAPVALKSGYRFREWGSPYRTPTPTETPIRITHILRPVAPPFVFDGTPGRYLADKSLICDVCRVNGKLYAILIEQMKIYAIEPDGAFAGGRITGRVEQ